MVTWIEIFQWGALGLSVVLGIQSLKQYTQYSHLRRQAQNQPILNRTQLKGSPSLKGSLKTQFHNQLNGISSAVVMLKTSCNAAEKRAFDIKLGSNHILFDCLPLDTYFHWVKQAVESQGEDGKGGHRRMRWFDERNDLHEMPPKLTTTDLLTYSSQYQGIFESKDPPGTFSTIFKYALGVIAAVMELPFSSRTVTDDHLTVQGPHWGTLTITASMVINTPFILCCQIKDGVIVAEVAGLSRADVVSYFQSQETMLMLEVMLAAATVYLASHQTVLPLVLKCKRRVAEWWQSFKERRGEGAERDGPGHYNPAQVNEEGTCIICYAGCKNIIFNKCKHMIICNKCFANPVNEISQCPYCRKDIGDDYLQLMQYAG